ncbi:MAG: hypothetical protein ACRDIV_07460 [Ktedonobacteraceae bacterium]
METWNDLAKKLAMATVETIVKLTPVQNVLLTAAIDRFGDLIFGIQKSQDQISTSLARIEKELYRQTLTHFHAALRNLKEVFATKSSSQRKILLNNARERFAYVVESESMPALIRAQALFYMGFCEDLLHEPGTALMNYQEAYEVVQQDENFKIIAANASHGYLTTGVPEIDKLLPSTFYNNPGPALLSTKEKEQFRKSYNQAKEVVIFLQAISRLLAVRGYSVPDDTLLKIEALKKQIG